jgi:hypothetical protein
VIEEVWSDADAAGETYLLAVVVRAGSPPGIAFHTEPSSPLQLATMRHPAGHVIPPHTHHAAPRVVTLTQEALFVRSGLLRADLYDCERNHAGSKTLEAGDVMLLIRGGHGFTFLEETELIEVKQGPYQSGEKVRFEGVERRVDMGTRADTVKNLGPPHLGGA